MVPHRLPLGQLDKITLSELLGALSHALDITEGQPDGHACGSRIGMEIGREMGMSQAELWELYYTLLLKDLGCSSNAARICELYLTDDLSFKHGLKFSDSLPQALGFVRKHTGLKAGLAERFRPSVNILQDGRAIARELIATRCFRAAPTSHACCVSRSGSPPASTALTSTSTAEASRPGLEGESHSRCIRASRCWRR